MSAARRAFVLCFVFAGCLTGAGRAQDVVKNRKATLEERLTFALRVRTADEKKFIKKVVGLVKAGTLKQKVVDESFFWVQREIERKKQGHKDARKNIDKYPFFYFKRIVILNAKRSNVIIK